MKKTLLAGISAILAAGCVTTAQAEDAYQRFKKDLYNKTGISFDGDISLLGQRAAPGGRVTPWQTVYYGEVNWDAYKSRFGNGSFNISYTSARYYGTYDGEYLGSKIGVASDLNDYSTNSNYFNELSYTHQFVGDMKWLAITVGQFPMYNFDSNPYMSNQQIDFNNLAMSQNGTYSYPSASMGAYATFTPNEKWSASIGFQDAHNVTGNDLEFDTATDGKYTGFGALSYTPTIAGLGQGTYGFLFYHQPSVKEQPEESYGWSFNFSQNLGEKWAVFGRINGTTHSASLKQSYALGGAYLNPFNRNELDMWGFGVAVNKPNRKILGSDARKMETVLETYYDFAINDYLLITPDIQMYVKPALERDTDIATVYSIRFTLMF